MNDESDFSLPVKGSIRRLLWAEGNASLSRRHDGATKMLNSEMISRRVREENRGAEKVTYREMRFLSEGNDLG